MRLEDLSHLPKVKGPLSGDNEVDLPKVPVELADVEFENSGMYRPIYVRGILQVEDDEPFLVWANHIDVSNEQRSNILKTELNKVTRYRVQVRYNPFS